MLTKEIINFLNESAFINLATCTDDLQPNVSSKFLIKVNRNHLWLGDYCLDRSYANIKANPKASLSAMDLDKLIGYQIAGVASVVENEGEIKILLENFSQKKTYFSIKRVIEGLHKEKPHSDFEVSFPERIIIYKIKANEVVKVKPTGIIDQKN